jgi:hypothetical protein
MSFSIANLIAFRTAELVKAAQLPAFNEAIFE